MSFSNDCKTELAEKELKPNESLTELEAMLRLGASIIFRESKCILSFEVSNPHIIKRFISLVKKEYNIETNLFTHQIKRLKNIMYYSVMIYDQADVIIEDLNLLNKYDSLTDTISVNLKEAYLRGCFLTRGSVNDPNKGNYHLEITTTSQFDALTIQRLMNDFNLNAKIVKRRNNYVVYIKDVSSISDFLRIIGISSNVFVLDNLVIKREYKAKITRKINAEIANQMKTLSASNKQLKYIRVIEYNYPLEKLDPKLLMVMKVRKENPDASLNELLNILEKKYDEKISKSGLNHRFLKLKELANQINTKS